MYYTDRHLIKRRVSPYGLIRFVPYRSFGVSDIGGYLYE